MTTAVSTLNKSLLEKIAAKRKEIKAKTNRTDIIKPASGKHKYRILPAKSGDDMFWADFGRHYVKNLDGKMAAVYVCVEQTFGKPCAICQEIARAGKHASDDAELKALEESRCKRADVLVNVLHLSNAEKANTPQVMSISPTTFDKILAVFEEYQTEGVDITSLTDGIDIVIERTGAGLNTEYGVMAAVKSKPVPATVMDSVVDLQEFVQQESESDLRKAINAVNSIVGIIDAPSSAAIAAPASRAAIAAPSAASASVVKDDDLTDDDLDSLIEDADFEEVKATSTSDAVPFDTTETKASAPVASSSDVDIDALLGELDM